VLKLKILKEISGKKRYKKYIFYSLPLRGEILPIFPPLRGRIKVGVRYFLLTFFKILTLLISVIKYQCKKEHRKLFGG
jgi:hypothetical protein